MDVMGESATLCWGENNNMPLKNKPVEINIERMLCFLMEEL
jgi:hypothetical protein